MILLRGIHWYIKSCKFPNTFLCCKNVGSGFKLDVLPSNLLQSSMHFSNTIFIQQNTPCPGYYSFLKNAESQMYLFYDIIEREFTLKKKESDHPGFYLTVGYEQEICCFANEV